MTMTYTTTKTNSFTLSNAKYVASKLAADLRRMQLLYGEPSDGDIDKYADEVAILLHGGYFERVRYGFRRDGKWLVVLEYEAKADGTLGDDRAGGLPRTAVDVSGASWYSFLTYTAAFSNLSAAAKQALNLPISRTNGEEPVLPPNVGSTRAYSVNGIGLSRRVLQ